MGNFTEDQSAGHVDAYNCDRGEQYADLGHRNYVGQTLKADGSFQLSDRVCEMVQCGVGTQSILAGGFHDGMPDEVESHIGLLNIKFEELDKNKSGHVIEDMHELRRFINFELLNLSRQSAGGFLHCFRDMIALVRLGTIQALKDIGYCAG